MLHTLGILTARVMMSPSAAHDETWVTLTTDYVLSSVAYARQLKRYPEFLRPLVYRFLPGYTAVQCQLNEGRGMIWRTIREQDENEAKGIPPEEPTTVIYAMTRQQEDKTPRAIESHLREQLNLAVGGIHTTSSVLTQTLFELAAHPEYIPQLRMEALAAAEKCNGHFDKGVLWDMHKLDSFIRETHRLNSPNMSKSAYDTSQVGP
jgi:cytochrome P450